MDPLGGTTARTDEQSFRLWVIVAGEEVVPSEVDISSDEELLKEAVPNVAARGPPANRPSD